MLKKGLPRSAQPRTVACIVHGCLYIYICVSLYVCLCVYGCPPNPLPPTLCRQSALMQLENALRMFCIACLALLFVLFVSLSHSLSLSLSPSLFCLLYLSICWCVCRCVCQFAVTNRVCCRRAAHAFCARFLSPASCN